MKKYLVIILGLLCIGKVAFAQTTLEEYKINCIFNLVMQSDAPTAKYLQDQLDCFGVKFLSYRQTAIKLQEIGDVFYITILYRKDNNELMATKNYIQNSLSKPFDANVFPLKIKDDKSHGYALNRDDDFRRELKKAFQFDNLEEKSSQATVEYISAASDLLEDISKVPCWAKRRYDYREMPLWVQAKTQNVVELWKWSATFQFLRVVKQELKRQTNNF